MARLECKCQELKLLVRKAETQKIVTILEVEIEDYRLRNLQERLEKYPQAAKYDWESQQLEVARGLENNTRAFLQLGSASEIVRTFMMNDQPTDSRVANDGS